MYSSLKSGNNSKPQFTDPEFRTIYLYAIPAEQQFKINKFGDIQEE
jgi:hypothetical protein